MLERSQLYLGDISGLLALLHSAVDKRKYLAINPDCYLIASRDAEYRSILQAADAMVYVDGGGIILAQRLLGEPVAAERISTTDLFPALYEYETQHLHPKSFFLFGGTVGTAQRVRENFTARFGKDLVVGVHAGYDYSDADLIAEVNSLRPDYLFVGLGCPKQEKWVANHFQQLDVQTIITCGGLFDYYAGNVKRAPKWMQRLYLEWLFRLLQEPKRLARRYLIGNWQFLFRILRLRLRGEPL